jgi:hypothetical protein
MQVFVHALQKVDMRAVVGQSSSTSLAVAGGTMQRQVACYSSHPDELQAAPNVMQLSAGSISALQLVFKPLHAGQEWVSTCSNVLIQNSCALRALRRSPAKCQHLSGVLQARRYMFV